MKKLNFDRKHVMTWAGNCYACICRVCNMRKCRHSTHFDRCVHCNVISDRAIIDCDGFESRYRVRVFRVKRSVLGKRRPTIFMMVNEMWKSGKWK